MPGSRAPPTLSRYLENRLLDANQQDHQRNLPQGYGLEFHKGTHTHVLKHEASDIRLCIHPLDLVERTDRAIRNEPADITYIYLSDAATFARIARWAHREPMKAWKLLVETKIVLPGQDCNGGVWWQGPLSSLEPAKAFADAQLPAAWRAGPFCLAIHLPTELRRSSQEGASISELWFLGEAPKEVSPGVWRWPELPEGKPQVELGVQLIESAYRRDPRKVQELLEAGASPDYQDARGFTALHAACATAPNWEVLDQLMVACDVCVRTRTGLLACDIADQGHHEDVALALKEKMQEHRTGKYLPAASTTLTAAAKAALGLTHVDYTEAAQVGKRRSQEESDNMLREFANVMMEKYKNTEAAFKAFDFNSNGTLSGAEFRQSAKQLNYSGDVTAVFKAIDLDRQGDISKVEFRMLQKIYNEDQDRKQKELMTGKY